jgi:hypothetical protein
MKKYSKNKTMNIILLTGILTVLIGISTFCFNVESVHASEKLNKTKITMTNKDLKTIKVKNPQKKVKWSISSKKYGSIETYGKKNSICDIYTDCKRRGNFTVTAKIGSRQLRCKVTVRKEKSSSTNSTDTDTDTNTEEVESNFDTLKEKLISDGTLNSQGKYEFSNVWYNTKGTYEYYENINYSLTTNIIQFVEGFENLSNGTYAILLIEFILSDTDYVYGTIVDAASDGTLFTGTGTFYSQNIESSADINFTEYDFTDTDLQSALKDLGDTLFDMGILKWNELLKNNNTGLSMEELGFSMYQLQQ